jgi:hypothetical protein
MRRVLVLLNMLSLPALTDMQFPSILTYLPAWADPEPRDVPSLPIVPPVVDPEKTRFVLGAEAVPFSDTSLAAILSNTVPRA